MLAHFEVLPPLRHCCHLHLLPKGLYRNSVSKWHVARPGFRGVGLPRAMSGLLAKMANPSGACSAVGGGGASSVGSKGGSRRAAGSGGSALVRAVGRQQAGSKRQAASSLGGGGGGPGVPGGGGGGGPPTKSSRRSCFCGICCVEVPVQDHQPK
eukprot:3954504-Pyramimonas_sp.AAC.1